MTRAFLGLGSNLGVRLANLQAALLLLEQAGVNVVRRSSIWETPPVPADQPAFLNAAVEVETALPPHELLALAKRIEHGLGRRPERHWGPRPIDIDILFYGDERIDDPVLTVPHPLVASRAFVLAPLSDITRAKLPGLLHTAAALLGELPDAASVRRTAYRL